MATVSLVIPADFGTGGTGIAPQNTLNPTLAEILAAFKTAINSNAGASANTSGAKHVKDGADGAAGTATTEVAFHVVKGTGTISAVEFVPSAALTADDTNFATITVARRRAGTSATIATLATTTAGTGSWVAWISEVAASLTNATLAADDVITFAIAKSGTGVVVPSGTLFLTIA